MRADKARDAGCFAKALPFELTFTLLGRDASAPSTIRRWCTHRIATGKNVASDPEIAEAYACAEMMEQEWAAIREALRIKEATK